MILTFSLVLAAAAPAAPVSVAPANQSNAAYDTKKICKKFPPPTGSRLGSRKVCRTQAQWDAEKEEANEATNRAQGKSSWQEGGLQAGAFNKGG